MALNLVSTFVRKRAGAWPFVFAVFGISRLLFFVAGGLAVALLPDATPPDELRNAPLTLGYWANWDGAWYAEIAGEGYAGPHSPTSTVFFPLYPMLVRVAAYVLPGGLVTWGVGISLISALAGLFFVYRIAEEIYDERAARAATLAMAFFPTAFFFNAFYTEALFLALSAGAVWAALVRRNLLLAGILGGLAAATRNPGVLLLIPLGYEWLRSREEFGLRGLAFLGLVPAGFVAYVAFLWVRFGEPFIFAREQATYWGRGLTNPISTLDWSWRTAVWGADHFLHPGRLFLARATEYSFEASNVVNLIFLAVFLYLAGAGLLGLPPGLSIYALVLVFQPILAPSSYVPLMSMPRFVLAAFPVFLIAGFLLSRTRTGLVVYLIASSAAGIVLVSLFTTWRWVA
ncbi:MAG: glycosyltransferase family 39 protein [Actinomycetota bacterium]|nr:glycosyltransferase family 39 protein [Actinomycetota bacterium]